MASVLTKVFVFSFVVVYVSASAIPMWEYLTKDEKVCTIFNRTPVQQSITQH